jgi:hypothetical protein
MHGKTSQWVKGSFGIGSLSDHCQRHISLLFSDIPALRTYICIKLFTQQAGGGLLPDTQSEHFSTRSYYSADVRQIDTPLPLGSPIEVSLLTP